MPPSGHRSHKAVDWIIVWILSPRRSRDFSKCHDCSFCIEFTVHNLLGQSKLNVLIWSSALNVIYKCFPSNYRNQTKFSEHDLRIVVSTNLQVSRVAFGYSKRSFLYILILREEVALVVKAQPAEIWICFKTEATFSKIWLRFWFGKSENALFSNPSS